MKSLSIGDSTSDLGMAEARRFLGEVLDLARAAYGPARKVLLVPPDHTRLHSQAGMLTRLLVDLLPDAHIRILPATGTHRAMGGAELSQMFGDLDPGLFLAHDHRLGVERLGTIESSFIESVSGGRLSFEYPGDYDRALVSGDWDLILSLGQVVPHEVVGMANYTKNLAVGLGGASSIDYSHWLGAVSNLESIMGEDESPVRAVLDESARRFLKDLPILYVHSVVSRRSDGGLALRGLFAGPGPDKDRSCFLQAAALARKVNIEILPEAPSTCVVGLDPMEFRSTWLGNKAVYRTRMALADGAELFILAPGVERFGEDPTVDALIRRHGYRGTEATLAAVERDPELRANLSAAAHLVHGSSEGRFRITYCTKELSRSEVEGVGYAWMDLDEAMERFRPRSLSEGWNGGPGPSGIFYVSNPALGLWKRALR